MVPRRRAATGSAGGAEETGQDRQCYIASTVLCGRCKPGWAPTPLHLADGYPVPTERLTRHVRVTRIAPRTVARPTCVAGQPTDKPPSPSVPYGAEFRQASSRNISSSFVAAHHARVDRTTTRRSQPSNRRTRPRRGCGYNPGSSGGTYLPVTSTPRVRPLISLDRPVEVRRATPEVELAGLLIVALGCDVSPRLDRLRKLRLLAAGGSALPAHRNVPRSPFGNTCAWSSSHTRRSVRRYQRRISQRISRSSRAMG